MTLGAGMLTKGTPMPTRGMSVITSAGPARYCGPPDSAVSALRRFHRSHAPMRIDIRPDSTKDRACSPPSASGPIYGRTRRAYSRRSRSCRWPLRLDHAMRVIEFGSPLHAVAVAIIEHVLLDLF